jgi:hypothetical protein
VVLLCQHRTYTLTVPVGYVFRPPPPPFLLLKAHCCSDNLKDLRLVSPDTVAALINGAYDDKYDRIIIVDCRFPYEFHGGHIRGACVLRLVVWLFSSPCVLVRLAAIVRAFSLFPPGCPALF